MTWRGREGWVLGHHRDDGTRIDMRARAEAVERGVDVVDVFFRLGSIEVWLGLRLDVIFGRGVDESDGGGGSDKLALSVENPGALFDAVDKNRTKGGVF